MESAIKYLFTWNLATNQNAQGGSEAKGEVDSEKHAMGTTTQHQLGHSTTAKHLERE